VLSGESLLHSLQLAMDLYRRFPFEIPDEHRNAVFRRPAQNQMDMIRHRVPFDQLDLFLSTQLPDNFTDAFTYLTKESFFSGTRER